MNNSMFKDADYLEFTKKTCKKFKIKLAHDPKTKMGSWIGGCDEIFIGDYSGDEELMAISFAHEVGHALISQKFHKKSGYNTLMAELECWHLGINYALDNFGLVFSDRAIKWAMETCMSYVGHDEREVLNWKFRKKIK